MFSLTVELICFVAHCDKNYTNNYRNCWQGNAVIRYVTDTVRYAHTATFEHVLDSRRTSFMIDVTSSLLSEKTESF